MRVIELMMLPNMLQPRSTTDLITKDLNGAAGFSILEVIASVVVLSVGVIAAVRMQVTAVATNRAPVASQEIATVARRALEEEVVGTRTISGYQVVVEVQGRCFVGTNLAACPAGSGPHVRRIVARVTNNVDNQVFQAVTFRAD